MALNETKFCLLWIVLSAVFISLSVATVAEQQKKGHRCYWCGPLAEQVHRSQRASSCNGDMSKVTICDEDLPYCAIVATSPPYIESRYCVKFYQDECYSLYCNSTKTSRITCPCRGELCNGINTRRENEAFEVLHKHNIAKLSQNKRPKRALISKAGFIGMTTRKNKIDNTTEIYKNAQNETISANIVTEADQKLNATTEMDTKSDDSQVNNTNTAVETEDTTESTESAKPEVTTNVSFDNAKAEVTSNENSETAKAEPASSGHSEMDAAVTTFAESSGATNAIEEPDKSNESQPDNTITIKETTIETNDNQMNEPNIQIDIPSANIDSDDLKTEIILMSSEVPNLVNDVKPNDTDAKITENIPKGQVSTLEMKPTTVEMHVASEVTTEMVKTTQSDPNLGKTKSKSSENLPAAEALQHNDTPTTKTTEHMSTITIAMTMNTHIDVATQATMPRNNTAVRVGANILPIVIGIILQY